MRVAIQGEQASFHELAAKEYYKIIPNFLYCDTFKQVFEALTKNSVECGFVATRNSRHGAIEETKKLLKLYAPLVEGEYNYPVRQHLVGIPGTTLGSVRTVVSHPVALSQCRESLRNYHTQEYHDTAAAMKYIGTLGDTTLAAVGGEVAAELYGLDIISRNIHDDPENITVFASIRLV